MLPPWPLALVLAPCVSSTMAQSKRPLLTAMCRAVSAVRLVTFTSEPYFSSSCVICAQARVCQVKERERNRQDNCLGMAGASCIVPGAGDGASLPSPSELSDGFTTGLQLLDVLGLRCKRNLAGGNRQTQSLRRPESLQTGGKKFAFFAFSSSLNKVSFCSKPPQGTSERDVILQEGKRSFH